MARHVPRSHLDARSWLGHAPVILLLASAAVMPARAPSVTVADNSGHTAPSVEPAMTMPVEQGAEARVTQAHQTFEKRVERWRPMSVEATDNVLRATGVQVDANLLLALVAVESAGRPDARSDTGAVGLTQVEPATFSDLQARYSGLLSGRSLDEPRTNLLAGALYLADCARALRADLADPGDLNLVLHAYNLGPRAAIEWQQRGTWTDHTAAGNQVRSDLPLQTVEHASRIMVAYTLSSGV